MTDLTKRYSDLLRSVTLRSSTTKASYLPNLGTTILPNITPTPREPSIGEKALAVVIAGIGLETYRFLYQITPFKRTLDMLMTSQILINNLKGKLFIADPVIKIHREYSYLIASAAKGLEGALFAIALTRGIISQSDLDKGVSIGNIFADYNGKLAKAKAYVLKPKDNGLVNKIAADWNRYRNKSLHYDSDYFIDNVHDAEKTLNEIYETIKLAYKLFIGPPDTFNP